MQLVSIAAFAATAYANKREKRNPYDGDSDALTWLTVTHKGVTIMGSRTDLDFSDDSIPDAPDGCYSFIPDRPFDSADVSAIVGLLHQEYSLEGGTGGIVENWNENPLQTGNTCGSSKQLFVTETPGGYGWWNPAGFLDGTEPNGVDTEYIPTCPTLHEYVYSTPLVVYACADPVNGSYSDWTDWGSCSEACGGGTKNRTKTCTNPSPAYGGLDCAQQSLGAASESTGCNEDPCPSEDTNGITAVCNKDNTISVAIKYDQNSTILSASYGSCNKTDLRGADASDVKSWDITLNPASCDMESKLRNLVYNQTATFSIGLEDGDTDLVFATFEVDSYCNYTSEYTVTFAYGPVNAAAYNFTDSGGLLGLNFYIASFGNDSYVNEAAPSTSAGDTIYLKIALNATNADFDHAASMDASTGKVYVPTKCDVEDDSSNSYTLFDVNASKCKNDIIGLSMTYLSGDNQSWYMEHTLFLLNSERISSYTLSCNILVCDAERITACKDATECLIF